MFDVKLIIWVPKTLAGEICLENSISMVEIFPLFLWNQFLRDVEKLKRRTDIKKSYLSTVTKVVYFTITEVQYI